jgi:hypothetical protein
LASSHIKLGGGRTHTEIKNMKNETTNNLNKDAKPVSVDHDGYTDILDGFCIDISTGVLEQFISICTALYYTELGLKYPVLNRYGDTTRASVREVYRKYRTAWADCPAVCDELVKFLSQSENLKKIDGGYADSQAICDEVDAYKIRLREAGQPLVKALREDQTS